MVEADNGYVEENSHQVKCIRDFSNTRKFITHRRGPIKYRIWQTEGSRPGVYSNRSTGMTL